MDYNDRLAELLMESIGSETLLNELMQALTYDELIENLEYIARNYDISTEEIK